jgi:hypothetical protein
MEIHVIRQQLIHESSVRFIQYTVHILVGKSDTLVDFVPRNPKIVKCSAI